MFLYLGEQGSPSSCLMSFNGGGHGQYPGGGGTDLRITKGTNWDDIESLKSRIIVAGGGGGPDSQIPGGSAGGIIGNDSENENTGNIYGKGGTQTYGGDGLFKGSLGKGGGTDNCDISGNGGGGGGYYGGGSSTRETDYGGGGGSSFISGYKECKAFQNLNDEKPSDQPIHYSNIIFHRGIIIDGNSKMPSPTGDEEIGHDGNGSARIFLIGSFNCTKQYSKILFAFPLSIFLLIWIK